MGRLYTEVPVDNWEKAKEFFSGRDTNWAFRGQSTAEWELQTSFERSIRKPMLSMQEHPLFYRKEGAVKGMLPVQWVESKLEREFMRAAHLYIREMHLPEHTVDWFALMQHYGVPTRLLDFTFSPYVAAFFALVQEAKQDRAIWAVNVRVLELSARSLLSSTYNELIQGIRLKDSLELSFERAFASSIDFEDFLFVAASNDIRLAIPLRGFSANERMMAQQGLFIVPTNIEVSFMENITPVIKDIKVPELLYKLVISETCRTEALADLQRMNITYASLFPGLEGYARSLASNFLASIDPELREVRLRRGFPGVDNEFE